MDKAPNPFAFPAIGEDKAQVMPKSVFNPGMTLRDYFAAKMMATYMADEIVAWDLEDLQEAAFSAYRAADVLLNERINAYDEEESEENCDTD